MPGTNAAVTRNVPSRLIESTVRHSANVISEKFFCGKMPAQFTTMSTLLNFLPTSLAMAATEASEATSHLTAMAWRPAVSTIFTVALLSPRSAMAMCTPSSANRFAKACPMPPAAPVMTATLSLWPLAIERPRFFQLPKLHMNCALRHRHRRFLDGLRQCRMCVAGASNVFGGCTKFHCYGSLGNHVAGVGADELQAEHAVGLRISEDFDETVGGQ